MKRSPLMILFVCVFIDLLGFGLIIPLLPVYVKYFGGTPTISGWMAGCYSLMQFLFAPLWGKLSDRVGRRPVIIGSLIGSAVSFTLFGLANSLWLLFAARVAGGILTSAGLPTAMAYITDSTTAENRGRGMAMIGTAFGLGFATGPWLGGKLAEHFGLAGPPFFAAAMAALNFFWALIALPESHHERKEVPHVSQWSQFQRAFSIPALAELFVLFIVVNFAFSNLEATLTWLLIGRFHLVESDAASLAGQVFGVVGVTVLVVQAALMSHLWRHIPSSRIWGSGIIGGFATGFLVWAILQTAGPLHTGLIVLGVILSLPTGFLLMAGMIGLISKYTGERGLVIFGALVMGITLIWIGHATIVWLMTLLTAILAVGDGLLNPSLSSLISQAAPQAERGSVMGVQQGLGSLMRIVGPVVGTWLFQHVGMPAPYWLAGILMLIGCGLGLKVKAHPATAESH